MGADQIVNGRYYLYYQCISGLYRRRQFESISVAWTDSLDGPWAKSEAPVLEPTRNAEWVGEEDDRTKVKGVPDFDSMCVHDPCVIVREGKYWLYYKGAPMGYKGERDVTGVMWGVAIADRPEGPFVRHPLNPGTNSGHEVCVWPYKEGVVALCTTDGPEKNTIQYAPDGVNFEVRANVMYPPTAAGLYCPDAYTNTDDGRGVTWGLSHIVGWLAPEGCHSYLIRFDCSLSQDEHFPRRKQAVHAGEGVYFQIGNRLRGSDLPFVQ